MIQPKQTYRISTAQRCNSCWHPVGTKIQRRHDTCTCNAHKCMLGAYRVRREVSMAGHNVSMRLFLWEEKPGETGVPLWCVFFLGRKKPEEPVESEGRSFAAHGAFLRGPAAHGASHPGECSRVCVFVCACRVHCGARALPPAVCCCGRVCDASREAQSGSAPV